jgi:hypothetical protein
MLALSAGVVPVTNIAKGILVVLLLFGGSAWAQGTNTAGIRSGYGAAASPPSTASPGTTSSGASPRPQNSIGTGQRRSEGAFGLSPQLQRELGISRQQ